MRDRDRLTVVQPLAAPATPGLEPTRAEHDRDMAVLGSLSDRMMEAANLLSENSYWRGSLITRANLLRVAAGSRRLHSIDGGES